MGSPCLFALDVRQDCRQIARHFMLQRPAVSSMVNTSMVTKMEYVEMYPKVPVPEVHFMILGCDDPLVASYTVMDRIDGLLLVYEPDTYSEDQFNTLLNSTLYFGVPIVLLAIRPNWLFIFGTFFPLIFSRRHWTNYRL